ncbi:hypothetical protein [Hymenobacter caeli]|nr:hypothetical protein [Hymenobacter caeli]
MKLAIPCSSCFYLLPDSQRGLNAPRPTYLRELGNTSLYDMTCDRGHQQRGWLANHKFEILFESGIKALKDEYYREAVTSFAVALERFYEFSIILLLMDNFFDENQRLRGLDVLPKFGKFWSKTLKFSERQLGAFCSLYISEFGQIPLLFDDSELRNKVIHAGYIPTLNEALVFGEGVNKSIKQFCKKYDEKDVGRPYKRATYVQRVSIALDGLKLKSPLITADYGHMTKVSLFVDATVDSYFNGSITIADYIASMPTS